MIKSLLDDDRSNEEEEDAKGGFLKESLKKEGFLTIDLSDSESAAGDDESPEEIIAAIEGIEHITLEEVSGSDQDPGESGSVPGAVRGSDRAAELEKKLREIEEELRLERASLSTDEFIETPGTRTAYSRSDLPPEDGPTEKSEPGPSDVPFSTEPFEPDSDLDTFRRSGMAWSAAIALFGSVVFMLTIGWIADVLLGSSPWGKVVGIVIGSAVGFLQFFRITSHILKPVESDFDKVSLRGISEPEDADRRPDGTDDGPAS